MDSQPQQTVDLGLIEMRTTRRGVSKAYIAGTRVSVENIYVCHELHGLTPDEVIASYPHLTLSQVHEALAYYYAHPDEIRRQLKEAEEFAEQCEADEGPTKFSQLRDAVLRKSNGGDGRSIPS